VKDLFGVFLVLQEVLEMMPRLERLHPHLRTALVIDGQVGTQRAGHGVHVDSPGILGPGILTAL
jgi:hypothetical protein